jgi:hypothetical protein
MEYDTKDDKMDPHWLSLELCKSIREIDCRIDELKIVLGEGPARKIDERRKSIVERVERLIETRFCLVYSLMDINPGLKKDEESLNPFDHFSVTYDLLKRNIK